MWNMQNVKLAILAFIFIQRPSDEKNKLIAC